MILQETILSEDQEKLHESRGLKAACKDWEGAKAAVRILAAIGEEGVALEAQAAMSSSGPRSWIPRHDL